MLVDRFSIAGKSVEAGGKPYVIAEAGSNFNQSMDTALKLIDAAAAAGADAVKFQLFRADVLYPDRGPVFDVLKSVELNADWVPKLAAHAAAQGVAFFASAFDLQSLAALEAAKVPAHKVASSEAVNLPLIAAMARTNKPIFFATGMCDLADITTALDVMASEGNESISLMQCGARYPLPDEAANLRVITTYRAAFGGPVGFSDHTLGRDAAIAALALGASTFEKHFTLDRQADGPDHFYAMEPNELKDYVSKLREIFIGFGTGVKMMLPEEKAVGRRDGLHARRAIPAGKAIDADDIEMKRPAVGMRGRDFMRAIGATARHDIAAGASIDWSDIRL